jgi:high-affinity Fe2+/Pb2+ permease
MFQIIVVIAVLVIFGLFAYGAFRAEKAVAAKAKVNREAHAKVSVKAAKKK